MPAITPGPPTSHCAWVVTAGEVAGEPVPEYTRTWTMTSSDWESLLAQAEYHAAMVSALEYARWLMDPHETNWVKVEWRWLS